MNDRPDADGTPLAAEAHAEYAVRTPLGTILQPYHRDYETAARYCDPASSVVARTLTTTATPWSPVDVTSATETAEPLPARVCGPDKPSEAPTEARGGAS